MHPGARGRRGLRAVAATAPRRALPRSIIQTSGAAFKSQLPTLAVACFQKVSPVLMLTPTHSERCSPCGSGGARDVELMKIPRRSRFCLLVSSSQASGCIATSCSSSFRINASFSK